MAWIAPKTNWQPTDTFDLVPDYARIRGNILHLHAWAARLYPAFSLRPMGDYSLCGIQEATLITTPQTATAQVFLPFAMVVPAPYRLATVPDVPFFSATDDNVDKLLDSTFRHSLAKRGRSYAENTSIWSAKDLNRIEGNLQQLAHNFRAQENAQPILKFTIGGGLFGSYF